MKKLVILGLGILLLGGAGAYFVLSRHGSAPRPQAAENTRSRETVELPEFVVNLSDRVSPHYLKVSVALEVGGPEDIEKTKKASPYIRDAMLLTLSRQRYEALLTEAGKHKLKRELLAQVQAVVKPEGARVSGILFTSFVMD